MFRIAWALALGLAAAENPFEKAGVWLQHNGKKVLETTEHCMSAARLGYNMQATCGAVFNPKGWAAYAVWGALEILKFDKHPLAQQLKNSDYVKTAMAEATKAVQNFTFESLEQFCNDKACFDGMHGMEVEYGACYGGTVCMALGGTLDFAKCKAVFEDCLPKSFHSQEHAACVKYRGEYCAQQAQRMLMESPVCYVRFNFPVMRQSPVCPLDCVDMWKKEVTEHPACMKVLEVQMKESWALSLKMTKGLLGASLDPEVRKHAQIYDTISMKTFAEACVNGTMDLELLV